MDIKLPLDRRNSKLFTKYQNIQETADILRKLDFDREDFSTRWGHGGVSVSLKKTVEKKYEFDCSLKNDIVTVLEGHINLGVNLITIPETEVVITGDEVWVFISINRDTRAGTIEFSNTFPESSYDTIRIPLRHYVFGLVYKEEPILHRGAVFSDLPIA